MSLTLDRLLDERPEMVVLRRMNPVGVDENGEIYEVDAYEYDMDAGYVDDKITFSCSAWAAKVLEERDDGTLRTEILWDSETEGSEGALDVYQVRGFTPGYDGPPKGNVPPSERINVTDVDRDLLA